MVSIRELKFALENLDVIGGDKGIEHVDSAIESLKIASDALNTVSVRGRANVDALLGIMFAIDMIIGKEGDNG